MSNKVIIGVDYGSYSFDASAKQITLSGVTTVSIEQFLLIVNVVDQQIIYSPIKAAYGGTVSGSVLTLEYDTTAMDDADELQVYFALDNSTDIHRTQINASSLPLPSGASTSALQTTGNTTLGNLLTELQLKADLSETQPVSVASLPLPSGASTSANQTNGTQKTQIYQEGADVGKNNGAWMKFSNDSITKSASGALLVNTPSILFDGKTLNADDTNFLWQNVGTGTFSWANNMCSMTVTAGQYCIRQSRRFMPYFSGYPVLAELTFDNFNIQADGTKRLGYFSSSAVAPHTANLDGFWLEMDGTTYRMISYNNGTETSNIAFASFTNYATLSGYSFDNFTAVLFSFLWLGGAYLAMWICTSTDGWILANLTPYVGLNKGTICKSPNQPVRYEVRSTTGNLDFRAVCSQVSVGGNIEKLGYSLPSFNSAAIPCNSIGTLYALQGFKKNSTYRDIAVKIESIGCVNGATTDTGILMVIRNPTLSASLTYAAYGKIDRAIATTQTVTVGTGDIIAIGTAGSSGGLNANLEDNYKSWLTQTLTNTFDEYVLCYFSTSTNQDVRGYAILKEY